MTRETKVEFRGGIPEVGLLVVSANRILITACGVNRSQLAELGRAASLVAGLMETEEEVDGRTIGRLLRSNGSVATPVTGLKEVENVERN